jgi:excisionase family DNA binding protein
VVVKPGVTSRATNMGAGAMEQHDVRLDVRAAAKVARVSDNLVYQWCQEKRLPHYRLGGQGRRGKILIKESDLLAFLESLKVTGPTPEEDDWG